MAALQMSDGRTPDAHAQLPQIGDENPSGSARATVVGSARDTHSGSGRDTHSAGASDLSTLGQPTVYGAPTVGLTRTAILSRTSS